MGKIFYLMGKSASGKDSIYTELRKRIPELKPVILYTTRPMRAGEQDGVQYYFIDEKKYDEFKSAGIIIESRDYNTVHGIWSYMTVKDDQIDLDSADYLMIGTLESYEKTLAFFGRDIMVPLYIHVDDGIRLQRALDREKQQKEPKYAEMCRRYLADEADFAKENLDRCEISRAYENIDFEKVVSELEETIRRK